MVVTAVGISSYVVIVLKQVDKHNILRLSYYANKKGLTPLFSLVIIKKNIVALKTNTKSFILGNEIEVDGKNLLA